MHAFKSSYFLLALGLLGLFGACKEEPISNPKPRTYPKVQYPTRHATHLGKDFCSFDFSYPDYMHFAHDTVLAALQTKNACWFNLEFPQLNGTLHFTYTPLNRDSIREGLYKVYSDAYKMAEEHNRKAVSNEDLIIHSPEKKVYGILFNIEGQVASSFQFILTDSSRHALRGALYFKSRPNADSMRPILEFVKEDVIGIINTFEWKE